MLILASASPRRQEILSMITANFEVALPEIEEIIPSDIPLQQAVIELARQKAEDVFKSYPTDIIIAADTVVELNGEIFGKPKDVKQAHYHLSSLSGGEHNVHTGVYLLSKTLKHGFCSTAKVCFDEISDAEIEGYISTDEPYDKAGSYAIQGIAGRFIKGITGDYYTVMGLPLNMLYRCLTDNNIL